MSFQKFMAQPLVMGSIVLSALFLGPFAIVVAAVLIGGWALNNRLQGEKSNPS